MKRKLENIIHPQVEKERKKWTEWATRQRYKIICYDIPLLFETKGEKSCDEVVVVSAPPLIQKQRALKRKNMDLKKFNNILTIGVAFSFQKYHKLPINNADVKLDYILTEKGIYQ